MRAVARCGWLIVTVACDYAPERVDPSEYPAAVRETGIAPELNNCESRLYPFTFDAVGLLEGTISGYAAYEYRPTQSQLTTIYLRGCDDRARTREYATLSFFGVTRVEAGEYTVHAAAEEEGGFLFSYTRNGRQAMQCSDRPTGTVTVTEATFSEVHGSFAVEVGCFADPDRQTAPARTTFTGTFSAQNIGLE